MQALSFCMLLQFFNIEEAILGWYAVSVITLLHYLKRISWIISKEWSKVTSVSNDTKRRNKFIFLIFFLFCRCEEMCKWSPILPLSIRRFSIAGLNSTAALSFKKLKEYRDEKAACATFCHRGCRFKGNELIVGWHVHSTWTRKKRSPLVNERVVANESQENYRCDWVK